MTEQFTVAPKADRLHYLDSLRGIAALIVVLSHFWMMVPDPIRLAPRSLSSAMHSFPEFWLYMLGKLQEAARASVLLFFVLSGFVLAYSLQKKHTPYLAYAIKRFFRIYPVFLFAILGSYALHSVIGVRHDVGSAWYAREIDPDMTWLSLLKHFALWGTPEAHWLDGPAWSLFHEMRISLIFPLILLCVRRYGVLSLVGFSLLSVFCTMWILHSTGFIANGYDEKTFLLSLVDTGYFIVFFAAGAYVAVNRDHIIARVSGFSHWKLLMMVGVAVYGMLCASRDSQALIGALSDYLHGVGALIVIMVALSFQRFSQLLSHRSLLWLGRISYSLYLVHMPLIYVVDQVFGEHWSLLQVALVSLPLSLVVAELTARYVEFPAMRLGRRFVERKVASG